MDDKIRVRFAPSPTGPLHIGGVRTALYNYLIAKKNKGSFILRIEDTDQNRWVKGAEDYIYNALEWCGLEFDEDPKKGGKFAPYKQSERKEIYQKYQKKILETDYAYIAFDTNEELELLRQKLEKEGKVFAYNYETRKYLKNSLTMSQTEVEMKLNSGVPYVVRFKIPENRTLKLHDIIRGNFTINTQTLDDKVLVKNDGMPTYHFANIVDDHLMEITHVIRGEEWLPSMALHELLYEAMGWESPQFAHLPLILKPEGKGKLSKRDGEKYGFPVFPLEWIDEENQVYLKGYKEQGYFPEAFLNMLALLGWSPSGDKEIISLQEMIDEFDLSKVHKAGARFNPEKAKWFNHEYIQKKSAEELYPELLIILKKNNILVDDREKPLKIISLLKERINFVEDIWKENQYFWKTPSSYNEKSYNKVIKEDAKDIIRSLSSMIGEISNFEEQEITQSIHQYIENNNLGIGKIMQILRLAIVGEMKGPDIPIIMSILGKKESGNRLNALLQTIN